MNTGNSIYNGQFNGNILVVGRTGCGKTTFLEKLAINKFFGDIIKTEWVSGIEIDTSQEAEIQFCFSNPTQVHTATEKDDLDALLELFKSNALETEGDNVNLSNSFGEIRKMDRLIVLDDVSGVADLSKKFANFLTVSRKYGYNVVYVFHVIIPSNQIWQKILSQTNIFNIFPASVPFNSVSKILQANCISRGKGYIPVRSLWLTRLFTELANSHEKHCLTLDCSYLNKNGPGRYRTRAENPEKQVCYFAKPNDDKFFNTFLSNRIKTAEYEDKIYFQIERIRSADGSHTFSVRKTPENGTSRALNLANTNKLEAVQKDLQTLLSTFSEGIESQQDLNFSMDDNVADFKKMPVSKKRNTLYSSTKVKARNLLTNVGYRRFKDSDSLNLNFIIDLLSFLIQNFNPINLDRKVDTEDEQLMIRFIWEKCVPYELTAEIYKQPNYQILADPKLTYHRANQIIKNWIVNFEKKKELIKLISDNFKHIHYIYSCLFPKVYARVNLFGIKNKSDFDLAFSFFKVEKQTNQNFKQTDIKTFFAGKDPEVSVKREEVHPSEQKPVEINENDKWTLQKPKPKPKLPTQRKKSVGLSSEEYKKQKADLKRRLDENTEKLEAIKKAKKNFQKKAIYLK